MSVTRRSDGLPGRRSPFLLVTTSHNRTPHGPSAMETPADVADVFRRPIICCKKEFWDTDTFKEHGRLVHQPCRELPDVAAGGSRKFLKKRDSSNLQPCVQEDGGVPSLPKFIPDVALHGGVPQSERSQRTPVQGSVATGQWRRRRHSAGNVSVDTSFAMLSLGERPSTSEVGASGSTATPSATETQFRLSRSDTAAALSPVQAHHHLVTPAQQSDARREKKKRLCRQRASRETRTGVRRRILPGHGTEAENLDQLRRERKRRPESPDPETIEPLERRRSK